MNGRHRLPQNCLRVRTVTSSTEAQQNLHLKVSYSISLTMNDGHNAMLYFRCLVPAFDYLTEPDVDRISRIRRVTSIELPQA